MLERKNLFIIGLTLVLVASWSIGNISYMFSNLGNEDTNYGFVGAENQSYEIFDISIYMFFLVFFIIGILLYMLYIYKKYGMEVLSMPITIVGVMIFFGLFSFLVGSHMTAVVILMTIIGVITFAFTAHKRGWAKFNIILVSVLIMIAVPVLYRFYQTFEGGGVDFIDKSSTVSKIGDSGRELVSGVTGIGSQNLGLVVITILLVIIGVISLLPKIAHYLKKDELKKEERTQIEKDLSESVNRAIKDLNKGKDIRSTVIRCYQKMCFILEDYGITYDRYMTPREFENNAVNNLNFSRDTIDDLTSTFEEARYSSHSLKEDHRKRAIKDLKSLREEI